MAPALTTRASQPLQLPYAPPLPSLAPLSSPAAFSTTNRSSSPLTVRSYPQQREPQDSYTTLADKGLIKVVRRFPAAVLLDGLNRAGLQQKQTQELLHSRRPPTTNIVALPQQQKLRPLASSSPLATLLNSPPLALNGKTALRPGRPHPLLPGRTFSTTMNGGRPVSDTQQQQSHVGNSGSSKRGGSSGGGSGGGMGLSKVNATSFLGNGDGGMGQVTAEVKRERQDMEGSVLATPVAMIGRHVQRKGFHASTQVPAPVAMTPAAAASAIRDKSAARERFQANLERRTERMLRRVRKLQATQSARHVSAQLVGLVGHQRNTLHLANPRLPEQMSGRVSDAVVGHTYTAASLHLPPPTPYSDCSTSTSSPCSSSSTSSSAAGQPDVPRGSGGGPDGYLQSNEAKGLSTSKLVTLVLEMKNGGGGSGGGGSGPPAANLRRSSVPPGSLGVANCLYGVRLAPTGGYAGGTLSQPVEPPRLDSRLCDELRWTSGNLLNNLSLLEREVDSEATASSSGGESCDEQETEPPPPREVGDKRTKSLPFHKRSSWKWAAERAGVVSRWTWLQAQVSELEYRIRQTADIYKQIRAIKEPVVDYPKPSPAPAPSPQLNGFISSNSGTALRPPLDGMSSSSSLSSAGAPMDADDPDEGCTSSRTCPLRSLRKRKLLRTPGLHLSTNRKAARLSTVRCTCQCPTRICNTCSGRHNHVMPVDPERMNLNDRLALLDPAFHPVLSFPQDASLALHFEALIRSAEYNKLGSKARTSAAMKKKSRGSSQINDHARKQCRKLKKNATATLTQRLRKRLSKEKRLPASQRRQVLRKKKQLAKRLNNQAALANQERSISESSACSSKRDSPVPSPGFQENSSSQASGNSSWGSLEPKELKANKSGGGSNMNTDRRRRLVGSEFDINNIVIPNSMATSAVERINYKEIITPKWRLADDVVPDPPADNCGDAEAALLEDEEDVTDEMCGRRHDRCEVDERKRFMGYQLNRQPISRRTRSATRSDSRADSSGANTPDPMSPHNVPLDHQGQQQQPQTPLHQDSPAVSPPPTPVAMAAGSNEELLLAQTPTILQQISRRRTTSLSRRDNRSVDERVASPDDMDEEFVPVAPWELRAFPLDDYQFELFERELKALADEPLAPRLRRRCTGEEGDSEEELDEDATARAEGVLDKDNAPAEWEENETAMPSSEGDPDWTPSLELEPDDQLLVLEGGRKEVTAAPTSAIESPHSPPP